MGMLCEEGTILIRSQYPADAILIRREKKIQKEN